MNSSFTFLVYFDEISFRWYGNGSSFTLLPVLARMPAFLDLLICLINPSIVRYSSCLGVHSQRTKWTFWMSFNKSFQQQKWILIRKLIKLLCWKNKKTKAKTCVQLMNYVHLVRLTNRVRKWIEMKWTYRPIYRINMYVFVDDSCFGATEYLLPHATQNMCQKSIHTKYK